MEGTRYDAYRDGSTACSSCFMMLHHCCFCCLPPTRALSIFGAPCHKGVLLYPIFIIRYKQAQEAPRKNNLVFFYSHPAAASSHAHQSNTWRRVIKDQKKLIKQGSESNIIAPHCHDTTKLKIRRVDFIYKPFVLRPSYLDNQTINLTFIIYSALRTHIHHE